MQNTDNISDKSIKKNRSNNDIQSKSETTEKLIKN